MLIPRDRSDAGSTFAPQLRQHWWYFASWVALFVIYPWGHSSTFLALVFGTTVWYRTRVQAQGMQSQAAATLDPVDSAVVGPSRTATTNGWKPKGPHRRPESGRPAQAAFALFYAYGGWAIVTSPWAAYPLVAVGGGVAILLLASAVALLGPDLAEGDGDLLRRLIPIGLVSAAVSGTYAIVHYMVMGMSRAETLFASFNGLGTLMALMLNLGMAHVLSTPSLPGGGRRAKWLAKRWAWLVPLALIGTALILSGSRGAVLGLVISLTIWLVAGGRRARVIALALVAVMAVVGLMSPRLVDRLSTALDISRNADRIELWDVAVRMWQDAPVTGVGTGNYSRLFRDYQRPGAWPRDAGSPHNLVLLALSEHGLVGLVLFGATLVLAVVAGIRLLRRRSPLWTGVVAGIAGTLAHDMVDHVVTSFEAGSVFWILFGAMIYAGFQPGYGRDRAGAAVSAPPREASNA